MRTMKKLIVLFSIVAVSFALQAGDSSSQKDKPACCAGKAASGVAKAEGCHGKATAQGGGCCAAKGSCPMKLAKADTVKKLQSPKAAGESR